MTATLTGRPYGRKYSKNFNIFKRSDFQNAFGHFQFDLKEDCLSELQKALRKRLKSAQIQLGC